VSGVPISGCLGDQHAAMLGQSCQKGEAKSTYGTGAFILLNTGEEIIQSKHGLLSTLTFKLGPKAPTNYAMEGSIAIAGAAVQWLRDSLGIISSASEIEELALKVESCGGVYFVPAFNGLFAPWWRDDARGVCIGITRFTSRAHIARAVLESMCFQVKDVLDSMHKDAGEGVRLRMRRGNSCLG
jgi:glycerol kinase